MEKIIEIMQIIMMSTGFLTINIFALVLMFGGEINVSINFGRLNKLIHLIKKYLK